MSQMEDYQKKLKQWQNKTLKEAERSITRQYRTLLREILAEVGDIYRKYETNGVLTSTEMAKYDRLSKFLDSLTDYVNTMSKQSQKSVEEYLREGYEHSYYWMAYTVEVAAQMTVGYAALAPDIIYAALNNPVRGLTLNETLEKNRRDIIYTIRNTTARGLTQGMTYKQMANEISKVIENDVGKAIRIARTEGHRVTHQAEIEVMERAHEKGIISTKEWKCSLDERVRKTRKANHRKLHGQKVPIDQDFDLGNGKYGKAPGVMPYPEHSINCRCFLVYDVVAVQGKKKKGMSDAQFDEWKKNLK